MVMAVATIGKSGARRKNEITPALLEDRGYRHPTIGAILCVYSFDPPRPWSNDQSAEELSRGRTSRAIRRRTFAARKLPSPSARPAARSKCLTRSSVLIFVLPTPLRGVGNPGTNALRPPRMTRDVFCPTSVMWMRFQCRSLRTSSSLSRGPPTLDW